MKTTVVTMNDSTPVLLAKGPVRVRLTALANAPAIGGPDITWETGHRTGGSDIDPEFLLSHGDKMYGIVPPGGGSQNIIVLEYGTP